MTKGRLIVLALLLRDGVHGKLGEKLAAISAWKREHAPQRVLALLERYHAWRRA